MCVCGAGNLIRGKCRVNPHYRLVVWSVQAIRNRVHKSTEQLVMHIHNIHFVVVIAPIWLAPLCTNIPAERQLAVVQSPSALHNCEFGLIVPELPHLNKQLVLDGIATILVGDVDEA